MASFLVDIHIPNKKKRPLYLNLLTYNIIVQSKSKDIHAAFPETPVKQILLSVNSNHASEEDAKADVKLPCFLYLF